jgi:hypothetical protein
MDILTLVLLAILIIILLILLYVCCIPIDLAVSSDKFGYAVVVTVTAVWGLFGVLLTKGEGKEETQVLFLGYPVMRREGFGVPGEKPEKEKRPVEEKKEGPSTEELMSDAKVILLPEVQSYIWRIIEAFLESFCIRNIDLQMTLGSSNPVTTGLFYGYFWALKGMLNPIEPLNMNMVPIFDRDILEWQLRSRVRIACLIRVLIPMLLLVLQPPVRRIVTKRVFSRG